MNNVEDLNTELNCTASNNYCKSTAGDYIFMFMPLIFIIILIPAIIWAVKKSNAK